MNHMVFLSALCKTPLCLNSYLYKRDIFSKCKNFYFFLLKSAFKLLTMYQIFHALSMPFSFFADTQYDF